MMIRYKQHRLTGMISMVAWLALCAVGFGDAGFPLRVNDVSGLDAPWPLVGGLPFAEGMLRDPAQIRIVDAVGDEVPAQIDVAATWRDGSIRWALAGFTASPQGAYRVAFDPPEGSPAAPELRIDERTGGMQIDTGVAVYAFRDDRLLPESAAMGDVVLLSDAGDGAYLVDNRGRLGRVAGAAAEVESTFLVRGPRRVVLLREGWYVTPEGERLARARIWFYFAAGSPAMRLTHSLVLTEDTNQLWVRDYGIAFRTPDTPRSAAFALDADHGGGKVEVAPGAQEAYLLQDTYPHFFDHASHAVVGKAPGNGLDALLTPERPNAMFWQHDWAGVGEVAGDWADARFATHGLTVVMPHLAPRFPKELAVGPDGLRAAFWSGRSGRELDFRSLTLVTELWQDYARRAPGGPAGLAAEPSNAQGMARTHDLWLIPRTDPADLEGARVRANAATHPPLLQSDPAWLTSTKAIGWTMHPKDLERFPEQEEVILKNYWEQQQARRESKNFNGFIDWGRHDTIRGLGQFFRLSHLVDYGLRTHVWGLYARSGERTYLDYGTGFNRFAGDLEFANWDTPDKFRGGFTLARDNSLPLYWGNRTTLVAGVTGDDIWNWALEYYLTGDAYAADRVDLQVEAFRRHWEQENLPERIQRGDGGFAFVRRLMRLYEWTWDDTFAEWARDWVTHLIDFDVPNAITDTIRHGPLYKTDRNLFYLSYYYKVTGDEMARRAFLQSIDYKYRFRRFRGAFGAQAYPAMLYSLAYRWTGNPHYLRVVNYIMEMGLEMESASVHANMHPTQSIPAGLAALAKVDEPIDPFPVTVWHGDPDASRLMVRHAGDGQPVVLRCALRMAAPFDDPRAALFAWANSRTQPEALPSPRLEAELAFQPQSGARADPRSWHVRIELPETLAGGIYLLDFPGATRVDVLESTAPETAVYAPEGFRSPGDRLPDYFRVGADTETLKLFLGIPMQIYRPDGTLAVSDENGELSIPVGGQPGAWSVRTAQSGVIRLLNAEPVFSRSPQWLVSDADAEPAPRFEPPTDTRAFVPGPDGQALHLPAGDTLRFPRGEAGHDRFAHFPGSQGTVEFWFRPNWSSTELPFPGGRGFNDRNFLSAGSHVLQYRRGRDRAGEVAALNLWAHGKDTNVGFTGPFGFDAGEWVHLAFTWQTFEGEPGTDGHYAVFVDGEPVAPDPRRPGGNHGVAHFWPGRVNGSLPFFRREADPTITIGPIDGTLARLRVSDVVRYTEPFAPSASLPPPDAHTRAQFPLDGSYTGVSGEGHTLELTP